MHNEPGDVEGRMSLWLHGCQPGQISYSLPRGDGKNDGAQPILSVCDTCCY